MKTRLCIAESVVINHLDCTQLPLKKGGRQRWKQRGMRDLNAYKWVNNASYFVAKRFPTDKPGCILCRCIGPVIANHSQFVISGVRKVNRTRCFRPYLRHSLTNSLHLSLPFSVSRVSRCLSLTLSVSLCLFRRLFLCLSLSHGRMHA